jgi:catechol-2,3-dioxygenase
MRLTHVSLPVADPARTARWFADVLGVGPDLLTLREGPVVGVHHLAFSVANGTFATTKEWLRDRVDLMAVDGQDEFEGPGSWNSRSLYFEGPEGAVLELIARRDLPDLPHVGVAPTNPILGLSEVGIAVPHVQAAAEVLQAELGVPAYDEAPSATFAAVGGVHGMLILVAEGRTWFPLNEHDAGAAAIDVEAVTTNGARSGTCPVGGGRLRIATGP